ncbi:MULTISPECIES: alpha/beta fold hydrolase [Brevibacterium]|uniref:Alpha/beta hydrolase n=1 Tax=Brevibacterium koreense TaxID=3140787 RepID=A0AAU7UQF3_9MICO|nr:MULTISPECIES: hypothetical protein [Brevibacterium]HCG55889.1 hypothetical protein [Brevibacterium sp.]
MIFSRLDCSPRWRERSGNLRIPTLIVRGRADLFFPVGHDEALAAAITGAHLLLREEMGTLGPGGASGAVTTAMLAL